MLAQVKAVGLCLYVCLHVCVCLSHQYCIVTTSHMVELIFGVHASLDLSYTEF